MKKSFKELLIQSIRTSAKYDSGTLQAPVAILWPDPEKQWEVVIDKLQDEMPELMVLGEYDPGKRKGPAIWLKCMVCRTLPEANWDESLVPVIYMPGVSRNDLKNLSEADPAIAPLMEYQYTGTLWIHRNGKEWTVSGFLQNKDEGIGVDLASDNETKDAAIKALKLIFKEPQIKYPSHVNSDFLYQLLFKNEEKSILEWMCRGDEFLNSMDAEKQHIFVSICQKKYGFYPSEKNILTIAEKLGMKKDASWSKVWDYYTLAPERFTRIVSLLEQVKPETMGEGLFAVPEETWPQKNAEAEEELRKKFEDIAKLTTEKARELIKELEKEHGKRRSWVWTELSKTNLAMALKHLSSLSEKTAQPYDATSIDLLVAYYKETGYLIDFAALKAMSSSKSQKEQKAVKVVLSSLYSPWLKKLTSKFQALISETSEIFNNLPVRNEESDCILFVDAFRFDIAKKWAEQIQQNNCKVDITTRWAPLPSVTANCKPFFSPVADKISNVSEFDNFRPQTKEKKSLSTYQYEAELDKAGYTFLKDISDLKHGQKIWMEIGKIDRFGHDEQAGLAHRIEELCNLINERVQDIFAAGYKKIKIVTDHGWLLVPGGMPRENLPKDHIDIRWGRCAVLKEGFTSSLLHLPWFWNNSVMVAYAPDISFFKANNEYAHGGISLQECLVPIITVESKAIAHQPVSVNVKWVGLKCSLQFKGVQPGYRVEIRTKHTDETTKITKTKIIDEDMKVSLFVEDADCENMAAFIVITDEDQVVIEKRQTIVGE